MSRSILILGMLFVQVTQSSMAQAFDFEVGTGLMAFDYVEYDDNNVFLDGETGLIPGVILKLKSQQKNYYMEWVGSAYYNKIEYDGETQLTARPVKADSEALVLDTHLKFGTNIPPFFGDEQSIYAGLGYRYWWRNILQGFIDSPGSPDNGDPVSGLLEEYHWYYGLLGYTINFDVSERVRLGLDLRITSMFNSKIDVDYLGYRGNDSKTLDLGDELGARFALPIEVKMSKSSLFITPYYEIIDIGKSNFVRVTRGGQPTLDFIVEPRSETRNLGIEVTWLW